MSKDYFYFNRTDRIVAIILLVIIVATGVIRIPSRVGEPEPTVESDTAMVTTYEKEQPVKKSYRRTYSADSTRRAYKKTDYSRSTATYGNRSGRQMTDSIIKDSVRYPGYTPKRRPESPVDLNAADSLLLITLPGIGPVFASRILRYREQLGGFVETSQLKEIKGVPDSVMEWFEITDTVIISPVLINSESVTGLRRHPYINFYQARSIVEFRKERGKFKGPEQLSLLEEFTAQDLERLLPYLDFR